MRSCQPESIATRRNETKRKNIKRLLTLLGVYRIVCTTHYVWLGTSMNSDPLESLRLELRRGSVVVAVLGALRREQYGYTLRKTLADHGLEIDEGTLYPLLRRLESQGLLNSQWREEAKRRKRFYLLSTEGAQVLEQLLAEWQKIDLSLREILKEQSHRNDCAISRIR